MHPRGGGAVILQPPTRARPGCENTPITAAPSRGSPGSVYLRPMYLGRVIGTCVATRKADGLTGVKLLVVQPLDRDGGAIGRPQVACDTVKAGPGDFVYLVGAREASHALDDAFVPVDAAIVGIVDEVHQPEKESA